MKRHEAPQIGLDASNKLMNQYKDLLQLLGHNNLLLDKEKETSINVPAKCEETNKKVSELINSFKVNINELKKVYQICVEDIKAHPSITENLKEFEKPEEKMLVEKSQKYQDIYKELQMKNKELKIIIDEVREIFTIINKLTEMETPQ